LLGDRFSTTLGDEMLNSKNVSEMNLQDAAITNYLGLRYVRTSALVWKKLQLFATLHYPMIVGSLIHAMVHARPDSAYAVSVLSRAMSKPDLWHFKGAQRLLLYRSTSGFVVFFGSSPVDYECKRQPLLTMSTMESEYVAA